jgi:acetone carboxylase gamma subunit
MKVDKQMLGDLIDERLDRSTIRAIQSGYKDPDRFDTYIELLQERAPWDDTIVLPFGEHMCIVGKGGGSYFVKCLHCGHEFCEHTENWKLEALIHVRDTEEKLLEIYPKMMHGDPAWEEIREYFLSRVQLAARARGRGRAPGVSTGARLPPGSRRVLQGVAGAGTAGVRS